MPEPEVRAEAIQWLGFAVGELAGARADLEREDLPPRLAAFRAQQAAEKAIKGLLILTGREFDRTHDLEALVLELPDDADLRSENYELEELTNFAVSSRYPDALVDIRRDDAIAAVQQAELIYDSVAADFQRLGGVERHEVASQ